MTLIVDANGLQCCGPCEDVMGLELLVEKWQAFGWAVEEIDGHDVPASRNAIDRLPLVSRRPSALICRTVKGKGFAFAENDPAWHYRFRLSADDCDRLRASLA